MLLAIVLLVVGLALLVWSADKLVYGSAAVAKNMGISPLVIGMTVLAMGSSAPEMIVSATAAFDGKTDTAIGNVLGSNIANIALILGITAMVKPLSIGSTVLRRELPMMMIVTLIAGALFWDGYLAFSEGLILIALFVAFILFMIKIGKSNNGESDIMVEQQESEIPDGVSNGKALLWVVVGLGLLLFSADLLVTNAVIIAKYLGMSDLVIGLTIIAVGTSLPELAASLAGVLKGEDDMAVGNIIGSNIFNILAVMGLPAIIHPSVISDLVMDRDFWVMLAISLLLVVMTFGKSRSINRIEGAALFLCFLAYIGYLFYNMSA